MDSSQGHVTTGVERVILPYGGRVYHTVQPSAPAVCLPGAEPRGMGNGCNVSVVGESSGIYVSPFFLFGEGHQDSMRGVGNSDLGDSHLAISTRVPRPGPSDIHSSLPSSTVVGSAGPAEDRGASQQSRQAPTSHLVTVHESLLPSGSSDRVIQLVSQSWHNLTENVCDYRWACWQDWCNEHSVACLNPLAPELANFLTSLSDKHRLSASTVKGYRSAVSTKIRQCRGPDLSNTQLLHDVARGLSLHEAWQPCRTPTWDLFVVLDALRLPPFELLYSVSFKF